jgi:inosine-uridine nucleoside N-ribohydrolase
MADRSHGARRVDLGDDDVLAVVIVVSDDPGFAVLAINSTNGAATSHPDVAALASLLPHITTRKD